MSSYLEIARSVTRKQSTGKGQAIELWRNGDRFFLVADESDAALAVHHGVGNRGEVWTPDEVELVATITDPTLRGEVAGWKRVMDGRLHD